MRPQTVAIAKQKKRHTEAAATEVRVCIISLGCVHVTRNLSANCQRNLSAIYLIYINLITFNCQSATFCAFKFVLYVLRCKIYICTVCISKVRTVNNPHTVCGLYLLSLFSQQQ